MNDMHIKSGIETNTYLHNHSSHKGEVCVKVCVGFSARLFYVLIPVKFRKEVLDERKLFFVT